MVEFSNGIIVLNDNPDETTEEEIREYAEFIGIDVDKEPHLMWIAEEGIRAPVPLPWKACQNGDELFYYNFDTQESVWSHPCEDKYIQLVETHRKAAAANGGTISPSSNSDMSLHSGPLAAPSVDSTSPGMPDSAQPGAATTDEAKSAASPNREEVLDVATLEADRKRLKLIMNELSDDESVSGESDVGGRVSNRYVGHSYTIGVTDTSSQAAGGQEPEQRPAAATVGDRGLAGVGLAPARCAPALGIRTDLDADEDDRNQDSSEGPSSSFSASHSGAHSQSSSRARPTGLPRPVLNQLECSGQGRSCSGRSSIPSEISDDFMSDFEANICGDTLELSVSASASITYTEEPDPRHARTSVLDAARGLLQFMAAEPTSPATAGRDAEPAPGTAAPAGGAGPTETAPPPATRPRACACLGADVASLGRALAMLRDVREKQQAILHLIVEGA